VGSVRPASGNGALLAVPARLPEGHKSDKICGRSASTSCVLRTPTVPVPLAHSGPDDAAGSPVPIHREAPVMPKVIEPENTGLAPKLSAIGEADAIEATQRGTSSLPSTSNSRGSRRWSRRLTQCNEEPEILAAKPLLAAQEASNVKLSDDQLDERRGAVAYDEKIEGLDNEQKKPVTYLEQLGLTSRDFKTKASDVKLSDEGEMCKSVVYDKETERLNKEKEL